MWSLSPALGMHDRPVRERVFRGGVLVGHLGLSGGGGAVRGWGNMERMSYKSQESGQVEYIGPSRQSIPSVFL